LGHVLVLERRYKDAEGPLVTGYNALTKLPGSQGNRIQNAQKDLVAVYEALNQPDKAGPFRAQLAAAGPAPKPAAH
jgi:hypothetical protein